jgi:outer membrane protein assembly factor BamB
MFGKFSGGYAGDPTTARQFIATVKLDGTMTFLDSTISGVERAAGPLFTSSHIYISVWLNKLDGKTPKIGGTVYPEGTYLVKYDLNGHIVWAKIQSEQWLPYQMATDSQGDIFVVYSTGSGPILCKYDHDGIQLTHSFPPGINPMFDQGNHLYVTGYDQLRKFNQVGSLVWSTYAPSDAVIAVDETGNSYVFTDGFSSNLNKLDVHGNQVWSISLPFSGRVAPRIECGNLYLTGTYGSNSPGDGNLICKVNANDGKIIWEIKIPYTEYKPYWSNCLTSSNGRVYMTAYEPDPGVRSSILIAIEDLSYVPVTTSLSNQQKKAWQLKVVPNPSNGLVLVTYSGDAPLNSLRVIDAIGKEVHQHYPKSFSSDTNYLIDLSRLTPGVYFVEVISSSGEKTIRRFVLQ